MEQAFGKLGESGDPELIKHFGMHIINSYEDMLNWAYRLRAATFPDNFSDLIEACAETVDRPASDIRNFIGKCVEQTNRIHPHLNGPQKDDPLRLEMTLNLSVDDEAVKRSNKELTKLKRCI
jgi:hypothetical protein